MEETGGILEGMPRQLRIEYPGAIYHVMNRGDHREPIFKDDLDREKFLVTLGQAKRGQKGSPISVSGQGAKRSPAATFFVSRL